MKNRKLPSEYAVPAEYNVPPEIAKPAPEFVKPAPECPEAAAEMRAAPPEFTASAVTKSVTDAEEEKKRRRNRRLRNLIQNTIAPVAATIAVVAVIFASFNFDPLGNDFLRMGSGPGHLPELTGVVAPTGTDVTPTNTPTPTAAATPTPTPALVSAVEGAITGAETKVLTMYHVEGVNGETFETSLTDGDPMPEVKAWLKTWGGYRKLMEQSRDKVFVGYEYSDDAIVVGDLDYLAGAYIAQGTVYAVYREDVHYYAFLDSHGPGYVEELDDEEDFPRLSNMAPDFAGAYAWSGVYTEEYLQVVIDRQTYFLVAGSYYVTEFNISTTDAPGATYDRATNTLTLDNCKADVIDANLMGNGFTIKLIGENEIGRIVLWGAGHSGSVTITGDGELYVNESEIYDCGFMIMGEGGPAALMVDRDAYVDIYGTKVAVLIAGTTMEKAIYTRGRMITGGTRGNGAFYGYNNDGVRAKNGMIVGVYSLAEMTEAVGEQCYDYTVITPEGEPGTRVQFIP